MARAATWMRPTSRPAIIWAKPCALDATEQGIGGHAAVVEVQLAALDALVAELGQVARDGEARDLLDQQDR